MDRRFALLVGMAMVLGVLSGWASHQFLSAPHLSLAIVLFSELTKIFLTLIKMVIAPLVLLTLISGIGHMDGAATVSRVGGRALGWFLGMSVLSLVLGAAIAGWLKPGIGMNLGLAARAPSAPSMRGFSLDAFVDHIIPASIFKAMSDNEILQIVVFAVFVGTAIASMEGGTPRIRSLVEEGVAIMLRITNLVMAFAPFAIFGALASTVAEQGLPILMVYAKFIAEFYGALATLWGLLIALGFLFLGRRTIKILRVIRDPILLSFSTASSEAAYPKLLAALPTVGIPRKVVSFVLPLGYSFNLDGSMIYCTFATLFIIQAYGVHFTLAQDAMLFFLLLITSKGIAGVPRASLVVIMATLTYFGLPAEWIGLVLGVDHLLDMGRSATNVLGNSLASAVIAKWEGPSDVFVPQIPT